MAYDNTNSGMLARNKRREKDTHPEYTGTLNVEGTEYWVSAWIKEGKPGSKLEGEKYFSIALTKKDAPRTASKPAPTPASDSLDDIPFDNPYKGKIALSI